MAGGGSGERRAFYRLRYPAAERPVARTAGGPLVVAELSEGGARLVVADGEPAVAAAVVGYVVFGDRGADRIEGTVLRHDAGEAVLRLSLGVPLRRMIAEQRRLLQLFPTHLDPPGPDAPPG